jgi:hypothetical protein
MWSHLAQEHSMKAGFREMIIRLLDQHRIMTVATNRPDGWPQATTVSYANDGLVLYSFIAHDGQKYANIQQDPRVSVRNREGLSAAARSQRPVIRRPGAGHRGTRRGRPCLRPVAASLSDMIRTSRCVAEASSRELGNIIGMSRESTNKQLRAWEQRKWVRLEPAALHCSSPRRSLS